MKKEERKDIIERYERNQNILKYPDICFCIEPQYCENDVLGQTSELFYDKLDLNKKNGYTVPIYKCLNCDKNIISPPAQ